MGVEAFQAYKRLCIKFYDSRKYPLTWEVG